MSFLNGRGPETSSFILSSSTLVTSVGGFNLPFTISLQSADVNRKIEISPDGINYTQPVYDSTDTSFLSVVIDAPIQKIKVTGAVNDILYLTK